jgi:hypothetical protein
MTGERDLERPAPGVEPGDAEGRELMPGLDLTALDEVQPREDPGEWSAADGEGPPGRAEGRSESCRPRQRRSSERLFSSCRLRRSSTQRFSV